MINDRRRRAHAPQNRQRAWSVEALGRELSAFASVSREEQQLLKLLARGQSELAPALSRLADSRGEFDETMQQHIRDLDQHIKHLASEITNGREQLAEEVRDELRLMSRTLSAQQRSRGAGGKQVKTG